MLLTGENLLLCLTAFFLAAILGACEGWQIEAGVLVLVSIAATIVENASWLEMRGASRRVRRNAPPGIAVGGCMPAMLLGSLAAVCSTSGIATGVLRTYFWAALGCTLQGLLSGILAFFEEGPRTQLFHACLIALLAFACAGPVVGMVGFCVVGLHAAMMNWALGWVRDCFTFGEALTVSQGVALLGVDALVMTACQHCDPAGALNVICITPRTAETLALEALLAGGIALSAVLALM